MKTRKPMRGLLTFSFHSASSTASLTLMGCLALMAVFLVTGNLMFFTFLVMAGFLIMPMYVMMSMGDKEGRWERFQLTFPVTRSNLLKMQYLSVALSLIIPTLLVLASIGLGTLLHPEHPDLGLTIGHLSLLLFLGMPFLMSGLFFILSMTKIGRGKEAGLISVLQMVAIGVVLGTPWLTERFEVSNEVVSVVIFAVAVLVFILSYFITRVLNNKMDY